MQIDVVSIFPELVQSWFEQGVIGRALKKDQPPASLNYWNPRDFSDDKFSRVDDRPFGGGPGMVMQYAPLAKTAAAINEKSKKECEKAQSARPLHIYLSPQGSRFNHHLAAELAKKPHIVLWCGRYEGIDQRFLDQYIDAQISIGDFVLSGGEMAAAIVIDSVLRLVPDVLGDSASAAEDSFATELLDCPHYTRPENIDKIRAPEILLSGNHALIARWRMKQALGITFLQRPDLLSKLQLNKQQQQLLNEFLSEQHFGEPS